MRITIFSLLFLALLTSGGISWNDQTSTNANPKDDEDQPEPPFVWVKCKADDWDGTMTAHADIEVDIDYVLEPRIPGVQYRAYANVSGTGDHGKQGSWNCYAYVPNDSDPRGDSWWLTVNKYADASWKDYFYILDRGDEDPVQKLWECTASAGVDGTHSGVEYEAIADAWNFF